MSDEKRFNRTSWLIGIAASVLAGCGANTAQNLANQETFSFYYVLLTPNAAGNYVVPINLDDFDPEHCGTIEVSDTALHRMISTGIYSPAGGNSRRFDFRMLSLCNSSRYLLDSSDLAAIRYAAPAKAEAQRSDGGTYNPGKIDIEVGQIRMVLYSEDNGALATGRMHPNPDPSQVHACSFPATIVGATGAPFSPINGPAGMQFFDFNLTALPSNPDRIAANMAFIARQPTGGARLVAWEGDIVLQDH